MNRGLRGIGELGLIVLLSAMASSGAAVRCGRFAASNVSPAPAVATGGCSGRAANHRLDFWLGDWVVYANGAIDGTSHIAPILGGCAIEEDWSDSTRAQGRSWFYVDTATGRLKQIWLTTRADELGGTKEKAEIPGGEPGSVQFQGLLTANSGKQILDRTTLTRQAGGTVRQLIELSADGGRSWTAEYDAIYRRAGALMHFLPRL